MNTENAAIYGEKLSSKKTAKFFIALTLIFLALTLWSVNSHSPDEIAITCAAFFLLFLFYSLNYKTLIIRISPARLKLQFGIFSWTVPSKNMTACEIDNSIPFIMKYGGAGIHFMMVHGRYRVSFNFLEYERVVIRLKRKQGWVSDISFSTQNPEQILAYLQQYELLRE